MIFLLLRGETKPRSSTTSGPAGSSFRDTQASFVRPPQQNGRGPEVGDHLNFQANYVRPPQQNGRGPEAWRSIKYFS